jgi:CheY-like chemotaxis protein
MKILIVDDEPALLETLCRGLNLHGHHCLVATDGRDALEILNRTNPEAVDLVLTDLSMPRVSGLELVHEIRTTLPALPVVVMSGLFQAGQVRQLAAQGVLVLKKPFCPDRLLEAIEAACDR